MNATATSARPLAAGPRLARPLLAVALAWTAIAVAFAGTFVDMWRVWGASGTFAHGYLIFPIALFLLWQRRQRWASLPLEPSFGGVLLVAIAALLWLAGTLLSLNVVMQFAVVAMLVASVPAVAGFAVLRAATFPLLFMFFAVPAGEELVPWLMDFTARFTVSALNAVGIPVYAEGRLISIPTGNFAVEKACSGIRYLIASIVLGTLFAHLYYRSLWRRLAFVALCVLVPILANGLRAFLIVMLAHLSDNRIAVGVDHLIYGWVFFGVVMLLVFWIGRQFAEPARTVTRDPAVAARRPEEEGASRKVRVAPWLALAAVLVPVFAGRLLAAVLENPPGEDPEMQMASRVPAPLAGWTGPIVASADWQPRFSGATHTLAATYLHGVQPVDVAVYAYDHEAPGAELINSENRLFDEERWTWLGERTLAVTLADGQRLPVLEVQVRDGLARRLIWRTFVVGGSGVQGGMQAKLQRARSLLQGGAGGGRALIVSAAQPAEGTAQPAVHEFLVNYYTPLLACLGDDTQSSVDCRPQPMP